jgi:hypothetical protein
MGEWLISVIGEKRLAEVTIGLAGEHDGLIAVEPYRLREVRAGA